MTGTAILLTGFGLVVVSLAIVLVAAHLEKDDRLRQADAYRGTAPEREVRRHG